MGTVLVTVAGPGSRLEVALPDDAPVGEIVPMLVRRSVPDPQPWSRWALGPPGGQPFAPGQTLRALRVGAGAELELRDMVAREPEAEQPPAPPEAGPAGAVDRDLLRQRVTDLAERLVGDVAGIRAGRNPLLEYAAPEARRRLRALAPGAFDRAAGAGFSGLSLAVTWHRDARSPIEALARFTEVDGGGGATSPRPGAAAAARRISIQMTLDPECRHLLEVTVSADPPVSRP